MLFPPLSRGYIFLLGFSSIAAFADLTDIVRTGTGGGVYEDLGDTKYAIGMDMKTGDIYRGRTQNNKNIWDTDNQVLIGEFATKTYVIETVNPLESELQQVQSDLQQVEGDVGNLTNTVQQVQETLEPLPNEVRTLSQDVGTLEKDVGTLEKDVETLEKEVDSGAACPACDKVKKYHNRARNSAALAGALAMVPQTMEQTRMFGLGAASSAGKNAFAAGYSQKWGSDKQHLVQVKVGIANSVKGGGVGYGFSW